VTLPNHHTSYCLRTTTVSQIKQASLEHTPLSAEDAYTQTAPEVSTEETVPAGSDPTTAHAGLTELQQPQINGISASEEIATPTVQAEGNVAGERWDSTSGAEKENIEDDYEVVPRPNEEVETPAVALGEASQPQTTGSLADDATVGNVAGEAWDTKAPGQEAAADSTPQTNGTPDDGFHEVAGKARGGRGGFRGRGEGEGRGGRGGRGNGRGRGGPRGGRGDGEGRGRGGRGRGPRGDGNAPARS
jgi:hypothetical protein